MYYRYESSERKVHRKKEIPNVAENILILLEGKKSDSEYLSYNLMLNSGKKSSHITRQFFFYSNSCVVRKKILNENKNNSPLCKLNGRSLAHCHLAAVNIWAHVDWYNAAISNWGNPILVTESTLNVGWGCWTQIWKGRAPFQSTLVVKFCSVLEGKIKIWKIMMYYEQTTDTKSWHTFTWPLSRWAKMTHTHTHLLLF